MGKGRRRQQGQALVEYALILLVMVIVVWAVLLLAGAQIGDFLQQIASGLFCLNGWRRSPVHHQAVY